MDTRSVVHMVGPDSEPVSGIAARLRTQGIEIVDEQPNMLLVSGSRNTVADALGEARGWSVSEVSTVPRPRTRPQVLRKP